MVVTQLTKIFAWIAVGIINLLFVFFSILRAVERGHHWQNVYAKACIIQILLEMLFYETSECIVVHYLIPSLVKNEVQAAAQSLHTAVEKICNDSTNVEMNSVILDFPAYFFVSRNIALKYPNLFESAIVLSYHTNDANIMFEQWRTASSESSFNFSIFRQLSTFSFTNFIISLLKKFGASPPSLQRMIIHLVQPIAASMLIILWLFLYKNLILAIIFSIFFICLFCYIYIQIRKDILDKAKVKNTNNKSVEILQNENDIPNATLQMRKQRSVFMDANKDESKIGNDQECSNTGYNKSSTNTIHPFDNNVKNDDIRYASATATVTSVSSQSQMNNSNIKISPTPEKITSQQSNPSPKNVSVELVPTNTTTTTNNNNTNIQEVDKRLKDLMDDGDSDENEDSDFIGNVIQKWTVSDDEVNDDDDDDDEDE
jgi:hypothetical protein